MSRSTLEVVKEVGVSKTSPVDKRGNEVFRKNRQLEQVIMHNALYLAALLVGFCSPYTGYNESFHSSHLSAVRGASFTGKGGRECYKSGDRTHSFREAF